MANIVEQTDTFFARNLDAFAEEIIKFHFIHRTSPGLGIESWLTTNKLADHPLATLSLHTVIELTS